MKQLIELADRKLLPDRLIRFGIRRLHKKRLQMEDCGDVVKQLQALQSFIARLRQSPIAVKPHKPNQQHYELPPSFFQQVLGKHLKYSGCYWPDGVQDLNQAEAQMLELTCQRAEIRNGMTILELGCGWGSLTLWMAEHYPNSKISTVSNSKHGTREAVRRRYERRYVPGQQLDLAEVEPERRASVVVDNDDPLDPRLARAD